MIAIRIPALAAVLLLAASSARAGEPLTLAEAERLAANRNPDLLAARSDLAAADAQRVAAAQLPNPTLSYSTALIPTDGTSASTDLGNGFYDRSYDTIVAVNQLVEIGGKRGARKRSAAEGYAASESRLLDVERLLPAAVVRAYTAALVSRSAAALARESSESLGKTAALAALREEAGQISKADRLQVEIAAARFEADAVQAEAGVATATLALEAILGLPASTSLPLADSLEGIARDLAPLPPPAEDDAAVAARPDVRAFESALRRAEADRDLQKAVRVPDPTFLAQYEREPPDKTNTVGFGVSFPLPVFNRNRAGLLAAEAAIAAARRDLALGQFRARRDIVSARAALSAAEIREERLAGEVLPKAEAVRETVSFAWERGAASLLELLEASRSANDARLAALSARADLAAARTDLLAALGGAARSERTPR